MEMGLHIVTRTVDVIVIHPNWLTIAGLPDGHLRCPASGAVASAGLFQWVWAPGSSMPERISNHGPDGGRWQLSTAAPGTERREAVRHRLLLETGDASLIHLLYRVPLSQIGAIDDAITEGMAVGKRLLTRDKRQGWSKDYRDEAVRRTVTRHVRGTLSELLDPAREAAA